MRRLWCLLLPAFMINTVFAMPPAEEAKARALIARIETEKDAVFIRNGNEYSSANAAEFLRRKCAKEWGGMADAREFVAKCASASSTSGKPYLIRLKGQAPRPSAEVLGEWLRGMEVNKRGSVAMDGRVERKKRGLSSTPRTTLKPDDGRF